MNWAYGIQMKCDWSDEQYEYDWFDGDDCGVWRDWDEWGYKESGWKREWLRRNDEISHNNEQINVTKWHDNVVTGHKIVANTIITKLRNEDEDGDDGDAPQPQSSPHLIITHTMMEAMTWW